MKKINALLSLVILVSLSAYGSGLVGKRAAAGVSPGKMETTCSQALDYVYGHNGRPVDMEKAWNLFNEASRAGSVEALYYIAEMYNYGLHVPQDMTKYISCLQEAASRGSVDAVADLGALNLYGSRRAIVPKDEQTGVKLLTAAAGQGHPRAMVYLGNCSRDGLGGIARDAERAYDYYSKAADAGNPQGYVEMAKCLISGIGVDEDPDKAYLYLVKAENAGSSDASRMLGNMYYHGDGRAPNDSIARTYYQTAIDQGNAEAMSDLAWMYIKGSGGLRMYLHAFELFGKAAGEDVPGAIEGLGMCYENGYGTPLDVPMAVSCYKRASETGSTRSLYQLYRVYRKGGQSFPADLVKARGYLDEGVKRGDSNALFALGNEYISGGIVEKDSIKGVEYINKAAEMGSVQALATLGNMYYSGQKVNRDFDQAFGYLQKAIRHPEDIDDELLALTYRNLAACYRFGRGTEVDIAKANAYTLMSNHLGDREMGDVMRFFNTSPSF